MKKRIGIILLSAIVLVSGCKTNSAGDGVNLLIDTDEAETVNDVPESLPERQSSEVCPETAEGSAETTVSPVETEDAPDETALVSPETTESPRETAQAFPETETSAEPVAEPVAQTARDGYLTEVTHFSGTLCDALSTAAKLEVEIDVPFGKQCYVYEDRVKTVSSGWPEDDTAYAYFADYEYYTEEIIAEYLEGYRDEEGLYETMTTKEQTDSGEDFYLKISRFYEDSSFTRVSNTFARGIYILENGHHMDWCYMNRNQFDEDVFLSDAIKSLKSVKISEYIPEQSEIDQAELDAIIEALIQAGEIQTEFPWRAEVADARTFEDKTTLDLRRSGEPNVLDVTVSGKNVTITDMLNIHVLHTDVVGRFGSPVEVDGAEENSVITFRVDKRNMKNVPMQNLIVLHYNEEDAWYDELPGKVDEVSCTVSAQTEGDGCYLLADLYEWYNVWGFPIPEGSEHEIEN
ncbi:MAG: hypothetical protein K2O14_08555 [Oscillospiraceae bacterium]|nr:hypothetical protein [Oscillospiraceae bacterium]